MSTYELQAKRIELELKGDEVGILALDQGIDTSRKYGGGVNQETQQLANKGFDLEEESKKRLNATLNKVHETNLLANDAVHNLEMQNAQILRINDSLQRLDGTMARTRRYLRYFG